MGERQHKHLRPFKDFVHQQYLGEGERIKHLYIHIHSGFSSGRGQNGKKVRGEEEFMSSRAPLSLSLNFPLIPSDLLVLEAHQGVDHTVEIIEEGEQVEAQLTPGLLLAVVENIGVHHADRIVHDLRPVGRPMEKPPQMVEEQRDVEAQRDPLPGTHEHQTEEAVDGVLRHHQSAKQVADPFNVENPLPRSGGIALINGVFEVCAELIKRDDLPDNEEDECGAQYQGEHVAEGRKGERHGCPSQPHDGSGRDGGREVAPRSASHTVLWVTPPLPPSFTGGGYSSVCTVPGRYRTQFLVTINNQLTLCLCCSHSCCEFVSFFVCV